MPVITPGERDYLSDPSILKESAKKNFIRENIRHLKQLERRNRRDKRKIDVIETPNVFAKRSLGKNKSQSKLGRRRLVESKSSRSLVKSTPRSPTTQIEATIEASNVFSKRSLGKSKSQAKVNRRRLVESKSSKSIIKSTPRSPTTQVELVKAAASARPGRAGRSKKVQAVKAQGTQAYEVDDNYDSESDTIQKKTSSRSQGEKKSQQAPSTQRERSFSPFNLDDIKREMKAVQDVDYVKLNQLVQYKPKRHVKSEKVDPNKAPPTYQKGVLPKYLREQKKDSGDMMEDQIVPMKEREHFQNVVSHSQMSTRKGGSKEAPVTCPPGHIQISDYERKQQLNEMRKHYADLINKLNRVPVHADTHKARQMKSELENELESLEAAISMFSKEKLFVKIS